ncbi:MAG: lysylphosphatidylglycerol synthase transmembrane domain-containing protein [Nitrospirota bacterium]|nr:lysylphosphatidylglycerol synthase transmembrane domain-containing protein [Nitrospirota bacterium]
MLSKRSSALVKSKKVLILILKLAVSSFSFYLISRKADMAQVIHILKSIGLFTFLSASALYILSQVLSTIRWQLLLPDKYPLKRLFSLYMIGAFFSSFLPGVVGGDAVRAYYLNKDSRKISITLAAVFMDRYIGFVTLMLIGISAFPFSLKVFGDSPHKWIMPGLFVSFVVGSILFFGVQLGKRFKLMTDVYEYFSMIRQQRAVIAKTMLLSVGVQMFNFVSVIILASRMGEDISLLILAAFLPIVTTIAALPISISGLGLREGAFVILLGLIHISPEAATSLSLAWFFSIFVGSLPGLVFYFFYEQQKGA